ncbi:KH domain-containing protein [Cetobacterium sp. 2A]|uniref:KH domain-containing protein n=1 Tax=Cetobacterium sp. 2A TaxID=2754723 RepID=UPI00163CCDD8|nr:KH domain-containing protein [Cetobacterium sp. 2A]MBC2856028.1 KH domain-containing protein [Cetobacterium sp. 2A]
MDLRVLEKSSKWGYMFYVSYRGEKFYSFDEMIGKTTVKGEFKRVMNSLGFTWAKGIQQAGRTDSKVSAEENILYVVSNYLGEFQEIISKFNIEMKDKMFIKKVEKTVPNLVFPDLIEKREYLYSLPKKQIVRENSEIEELCKTLSGTYDVSRFTDKKGLELKEHVRTVEISFHKNKLRFLGNSFMPKQVRITSGYILADKMEALPGKYLSLEKVYLKKELMDSVIIPRDDLHEENIAKIESTRDGKMYIFYVEKDKKGEVIGKNGKNIKSLRKNYKTIVVREI